MVYNFPPNASDQLRETTTHVNRLLNENSIAPDEAKRLIDQARLTEGMSRYYGLPLENGSAQTPEVEAKRKGLIELLSRR